MTTAIFLAFIFPHAVVITAVVGQLFSNSVAGYVPVYTNTKKVER